MRRVFALVVLLSFTLTGSSLAQSGSLSTALVVPEDAECLTHASVSEHTRAWLGRDTLDARVSIVIELGTDERHGVAFVLLDGEDVTARRMQGDRLGQYAHRALAGSVRWLLMRGLTDTCHRRDVDDRSPAALAPRTAPAAASGGRRTRR